MGGLVQREDEEVDSTWEDIPNVVDRISPL